MFARRGVILLVVIICVVALPGAAALGWYSYTKDPTFRPLGVTKADRDKQDEGRRADIIAHVRWDGITEAQSSDTFRQSLIQAFDIKNVDLHAIVTDAPNQGTSVTYEVGASRIGPFKKARAVKGVNAAIAAFYMLAARPSAPTSD
ncbi:hypothetical protein MUY35_06015 [Aliiroseovarius sp. S1339]|uniref:hypothetical protein n=1 Tax=Aliiroseovarius sp. S1339 TaxID=2936990 RepID=UPI0020C175F4|nr:hypothetical protein [Aliiroseovarius sp. S1339]MCK8463402.1 hypothetical protein [Aliiroseovarius sp. S1339]